MTRRLARYDVGWPGEFGLTVPIGTKIIHASIGERGGIVLWAAVPDLPHAGMETRHYRVYQRPSEAIDTTAIYIGSVDRNEYLDPLHIFEITDKRESRD